MSVARPARCLLSGRFAAAAKPGAAAAAATASIPQCHSFHSSARLEKRKPRFSNVRAVKMGLVNDEAVDKFTKEQFKPYSPEELEILRKHYTPEQMDALEAGEASIDPTDLTIQGRLRRDPYQLAYLDDFSRLVPTIDRAPKKVTTPPNPNPRWLTEEEAIEDMLNAERDGLKSLLELSDISEARWAKMSDKEKKTIKADLAQLIKEQRGDAARPKGVSESDILERSMLKDGNAPTNSAVAPTIGADIPGVSGIYKNPIDPEDNGLDDDGIYQDLKKRTGMSVAEMMDLTVKVLVVRLVHNQTRLGKVRSVWVMAIAGNRNGRLGIGEAKSVENGVAVQKAKLLAIQNMQPIRRYEERTIHGEVEAKVGGTIVKLAARPPGKSTQTQTPEAPPSGRRRFCLSPPGPMMLTQTLSRIRTSRAAPSVRDVPCLRYPRHGQPHAAVEEPDELGQGHVRGADQPEGPQRDRHRTGQEARRRTQRVLWRQRVIIVEKRRNANPCTKRHHGKRSHTHNLCTKPCRYKEAFPRPRVCLMNSRQCQVCASVYV